MVQSDKKLKKLSGFFLKNVVGNSKLYKKYS